MLDSKIVTKNLKGRYNFPHFRDNRLRWVNDLAQGHTTKKCESGLELDPRAYSPALHCPQRSLITPKHLTDKLHSTIIFRGVNCPSYFLLALPTLFYWIHERLCCLFLSILPITLHGKAAEPGRAHILQNLLNTEFLTAFQLRVVLKHSPQPPCNEDWLRWSNLKGTGNHIKQFWKPFYIWLFLELWKKLWFLGNKFNSAVTDPKSIILKYRSTIPYLNQIYFSILFQNAELFKI